jgi:large subunit ribosomal protein L18
MKIDKKRRREGKTNYKKRLELLKSDSNRFIVRKTNKYLIMQIIESNKAQDKVIYSVNTKELIKKGWPENKKNSLKSISAAYLGGLLLGEKAKGKLKGIIILDSGLIPSTKGSRIYSAVKGLSDSGIEINFDKKILPEERRIQGKHMKEDFSEQFIKIKNKISVK